MQRELSPLEYGVSRSTQTVPYTHTRQNRLLFAEIFRLIVEPQTIKKPPTPTIFLYSEYDQIGVISFMMPCTYTIKYEQLDVLTLIL